MPTNTDTQTEGQAKPDAEAEAEANTENNADADIVINSSTSVHADTDVNIDAEGTTCCGTSIMDPKFKELVVPRPFFFFLASSTKSVFIQEYLTAESAFLPTSYQWTS